MKYKNNFFGKLTVSFFILFLIAQGSLVTSTLAMELDEKKAKIKEEARSKLKGVFEDINKSKERNVSEIEEYTVHTPVKPFDSAYVKEIIHLSPIVTSNDCPLVAKVFKDLEKYTSEKSKLEKLVNIMELVNKLRINCHKSLPILTEYKGGGVVNSNGTQQGVVLLEKAKGIELGGLIKRISRGKLEEIDTIFKTIGEQMGALDALICKSKKNENEEGCYRLTHGDSHAGNFFYDKDTKQFYWIDLEGVRFSPIFNHMPIYGGGQHDDGGYKFVVGDIEDRGGIVRKSVVTNLVDDYVFGNFMGKRISLEELNKGVMNHVRALTSFFVGYLSQMDDETDQDIPKIRKGVINGYQEELKKKIITPIKASISSLMKESAIKGWEENVKKLEDSINELSSKNENTKLLQEEKMEAENILKRLKEEAVEAEKGELLGGLRLLLDDVEKTSQEVK